MAYGDLLVMIPVVHGYLGRSSHCSRHTSEGVGIHKSLSFLIRILIGISHPVPTNKVPMTTPTKGTFYWRVGEGSGHILEFENVAERGEPSTDTQANSIRLVGTYGCRTCVGLYVRIDDDRCLMLHINALPADRLNGTPPHNRLVSVALGQATCETVRRTLEELAEKEGWTPTGKETVVAACPMAEDDDFLKTDSAGKPLLYTGHYVMKAIREFLKNKGIEQHPWEGFIVDQRTGDVRVSAPFDAKRFGPGSELSMGMSLPPPAEFEGYVGAETLEDLKWLIFVPQLP